MLGGGNRRLPKRELLLSMDVFSFPSLRDEVHRQFRFSVIIPIHGILIGCYIKFMCGVDCTRMIVSAIIQLIQVHGVTAKE